MCAGRGNAEFGTKLTSVVDEIEEQAVIACVNNATRNHCARLSPFDESTRHHRRIEKVENCTTHCGWDIDNHMKQRNPKKLTPGNICLELKTVKPIEQQQNRNLC
jgi:hypothetical protein